MHVLLALQRLDGKLFAGLFRQGRRRAVVPLARALSRSGDGYLHVLLPLLLGIAGYPDTADLALLLLLSLALERPLYWCLKNSLRRRRPQEYLPDFHSLITASDRFSFPSGHSSGAFLLATSCAIVLGAPLLALFLWAIGVALSRVLLGVHFPGDTVAGAIMGGGAAGFCATMMGLL